MSLNNLENPECNVQDLKRLKGSEVKELREKILENQGFKCAICGKDIRNDPGIVLDHQHKLNKNQTLGTDGAGNNMYNTKFQHNFVYLIWNKINHKKYIGTKSSKRRT